MANLITGNSTNNYTIPAVPINFTTTNSRILCALPGTFTHTLTGSNLSNTMNFNTSIWFSSFYVPRKYTMTSLSTYVQVGLALSTVTLGIYSNQGGPSGDLPLGAPLVVGQAATTATAIATVTVSLVLNPNTLYWAAIQSSSNVTQAFQVGQSAMNCGTDSGITTAVGLVPAAIMLTNTYSAGALPTIVSGWAANVSAALPIIFFS